MIERSFHRAEKTTELKQKIGYTGSDTSTRRLLKPMGFSYRKSQNGRRFLLERNTIAAARMKFFRTTHERRSSGDVGQFII